MHLWVSCAKSECVQTAEDLTSWKIMLLGTLSARQVPHTAVAHYAIHLGRAHAAALARACCITAVLLRCHTSTQTLAIDYQSVGRWIAEYHVMPLHEAYSLWWSVNCSDSLC